LSNRVVVAGGGGAGFGQNESYGGNAGYPTGQAGGSGSPPTLVGGGGVARPMEDKAEVQTLLMVHIDRRKRRQFCGIGGSGGGGGGYYGGGGGGHGGFMVDASGGGGGSSFVRSSASNINYDAVSNTGDGYISLTYTNTSITSTSSSANSLTLWPYVLKNRRL